MATPPDCEHDFAGSRIDPSPISKPRDSAKRSIGAFAASTSPRISRMCMSRAAKVNASMSCLPMPSPWESSARRWQPRSSGLPASFQPRHAEHLVFLLATLYRDGDLRVS